MGVDEKAKEAIQNIKEKLEMKWEDWVKIEEDRSIKHFSNKILFL